MATSTLTRQGQTTIPKAIRDDPVTFDRALDGEEGFRVL